MRFIILKDETLKRLHETLDGKKRQKIILPSGRTYKGDWHMKTNDKVSSALNHLTRGGFHYSGGKIHHESFGVLPSVEAITEAVKEHPGEIAQALLDDALSESLPMELDAKTLQRAAVGAATLEDVERLTEARAEAAGKVFCLGQKLMDEAGYTRAAVERAAGLLLQLAKSGYIYRGRTIINLADVSEKLPEIDYSIIDAVLEKFPNEIAALLAEELKDLPDEIAARIDRSEATPEDVYELCGRLAMEATECES